MPSTSLPRRNFLRATLAASLLAGTSTQAAEPEAPPAILIDTNAWLGTWPIRHLPLAEPAALAKKLAENGVHRAWVSSLDGILQKDIGDVNARLARTCEGSLLFEPIGIVNPTLPNWEADVIACAQQHRMRGLRLIPSYHGYKLDDPRFVALLELATKHRLAVQLALILEDDRTQNAIWRTPAVDVTPLPHALEAIPGARVMLLNWTRIIAGKPVVLSLQGTSILFDIAMMEGITGIETTLAELPIERLCFGSYAPVFYFESARLKLRESDLTADQLRSISETNAQRFLAG
ncbi:MAG TPA: hypothetical protein VGM54_17600 [Chthoniobacter sp.]|jgi:hypothetical protein